MACEATGTPVPTLSWHKDGRELVLNDRVTATGGRLQIREIARGDAGVYSCHFRNVAGTASHIMKLVIQGERLSNGSFADTTNR